MKPTKPKQMFNAQQLFEINSAATNLANSAMFEAGILALGGDRYVGQNEGALPAHIKQMIKVLPIRMILEIIHNGGKDDETGN